MSQIDYIHFLPSLVWVIILFLGYYFFIVTVFVPEIYKIHRVRHNYLIWLSKELKKELYMGIVSINFNNNLKTKFLVWKIKGVLNFKSKLNKFLCI
jgi:hypothetical protein